MRFIYKVLIGLIVFNSMLVFLAGFFSINNVNPPESSSAINVTSDTTYTGYKIAGEILSIDLTTVSIMGVSITIGAIASILMKSPVPVGASLFSGFLALLYVKSAIVIDTIVGAQNNWILTGIISLVAILIGILATFTIVEMFAGQVGAD